jgi:hypothetical protein
LKLCKIDGAVIFLVFRFLLLVGLVRLFLFLLPIERGNPRMQFIDAAIKFGHPAAQVCVFLCEPVDFGQRRQPGHAVTPR